MFQSQQLNSSRLEFVDFARGASIFMIGAYHFFTCLATSSLGHVLVASGSAGVHMFFLLSGFGLGLSRRQPLGEFMRRRLLRVYVPYVMFVTIHAVLSLLTGMPVGELVRTYFGHILQYNIFSENLLASFGGHLWFMSTIFEVYLAFPLMLMLFEKVNDDRLFLLVSALVSFTYVSIIYSRGLYGQRMYTSVFLVYLWEIAIGIVLAKKAKSGVFRFWKVGSSTAFLCMAVALLVVYAIKEVPGSNVIDDFPVLVSVSSLCILLYNASGAVPLFRKAFVKLGKMSFSYYLTHVMVYWMFFPFFVKAGGMGGGVILLVAFVASFGVGYFYNVLVGRVLSMLSGSDSGGKRLQAAETVVR